MFLRRQMRWSRLTLRLNSSSAQMQRTSVSLEWSQTLRKRSSESSSMSTRTTPLKTNTWCFSSTIVRLICKLSVPAGTLYWRSTLVFTSSHLRSKRPTLMLWLCRGSSSMRDLQSGAMPLGSLANNMTIWQLTILWCTEKPWVISSLSLTSRVSSNSRCPMTR